MVDIPLYFQTLEQTQLVRVSRQVEPADTVPERAKVALQELLAGPRSRGLITPIPKGTELISAFWDKTNQRIYANFSDALIENHPGHTLSEWATIYSIVNTVVAQTPQIEEVQILVNGQPIREDRFNWDWSLPFKPDELFLEYQTMRD